MYTNNPNNLTPPSSADFPPGYRLGAWIVMQDFFVFGSTGKVFYGFIAHSESDPNRAIMAIRGTSDDLEWWDDISSLGMQTFNVPNCGSVGMGWEKIYETLEIIERPSAAAAPSSLKAAGSFSEQVAEHMRRRAAALAPAAAAGSIEVTGHSLGAALSTLYAAYNSLTHKIPIIQALYTFASPMIGDPTFVGVFNGLKLQLLGHPQRARHRRDFAAGTYVPARRYRSAARFAGQGAAVRRLLPRPGVLFASDRSGAAAWSRMPARNASGSRRWLKYANPPRSRGLGAGIDV